MNSDEPSTPESNGEKSEPSESDLRPSELFEKIPEDEREAFAEKLHSLGIHLTREEHYSGPLLPPNLAAGWNDLIPGSAARIFDLFEQQEIKKMEANDRVLAIAEEKFRNDSQLAKQKHDDSTASTRFVLKDNADKVRRGQWIAFVALILLTGGAFIMVHLGHSGEGIAVLIAEAAAAAGILVYQLRNNRA